MPLDPSLPLQVKAPDPVNAISSFLDLGLKKTALEKAKGTLASEISRSGSEARTAAAGADVAEANVQPLIAQQKAVTQTAETGAAASKYHLQGEQAQRGREIAASYIQDPDFVNGNSEAMIAKLAEARAVMVQSGIPPALAEANTAQLIARAANDPKSVRQILANIIQQGQTAQAQAQQSLVPVSAQQERGPNTPSGNPSLLQRSQFGGVEQVPLPQPGATPQPAAQPVAQPQAGKPAAPLQFPPGENAATYKTLSDEREAARTTVTAAPTVHALNREILSELDKTATGQYSGLIAKAQSIAGMLGLSGPSGANDEERAASAYDLVDKYTTMAATRAAQSMGNDTATALNAQIKQNASVERNPTAIRKSIKFNDAVLSGAEAHQQGLEAAMAANPQADVFVKRKFDQEWAKNFDPIIMQIYQAKRDGDTAELADLVKSLGPRKDEIMRKAQRLQELRTRGQ